jgi:hypothetical protein
LWLSRGIRRLARLLIRGRFGLCIGLRYRHGLL